MTFIVQYGTMEFWLDLKRWQPHWVIFSLQILQIIKCSVSIIKIIKWRQEAWGVLEYSVTREIYSASGAPRRCSGKESACQCKRCEFDPWVRNILWRRKWQPTEKFHGQRSLAGYSPWGHKEQDMTEWVHAHARTRTHTHTHTHTQ